MKKDYYEEGKLFGELLRRKIARRIIIYYEEGKLLGELL